MIDTHCHLTSDPIRSQIDQVMTRARMAGVHCMITVGTSPPDARLAQDLAHRYANVLATAGIQPHDAAEWPDQSEVADAMIELIRDRRVVALGEMGLDKYYKDPPIEDQRRVFAWQLELAIQLERDGVFSGPIIIHNRDATADVLAMIRDWGISGERFVFHCFTGAGSDLEQILDLGAMISFTGIVTFKNAASLAELALRVPLDRLMIETDSPYLTPEPHRKVRPNEPCYVPYVARFLAGRHRMSEEAFVQIVDANAVRFFRLPTE